MNAKGHAPPLGRFGYVPREMFVCMPRPERETELLSAVICQRKFENLQQSGQQKQRYRRKKVQPYRHCTPARYGRTEGNRELVRRDRFADENAGLYRQPLPSGRLKRGMTVTEKTAAVCGRRTCGDENLCAAGFPYPAEP